MDRGKSGGRIVRHRCSCGWVGDPILVGGGEGAAFALIESVPALCRACGTLTFRLVPRAGVEPAQLASRADELGAGSPPLPSRALEGIAAAAARGTIPCPFCRKEGLVLFRRGPAECPACGGATEESEEGTWS